MCEPIDADHMRKQVLPDGESHQALNLSAQAEVAGQRAREKLGLVVVAVHVPLERVLEVGRRGWLMITTAVSIKKK